MELILAHPFSHLGLLYLFLALLALNGVKKICEVFLGFPTFITLQPSKALGEN